MATPGKHAPCVEMSAVEIHAVCSLLDKGPHPDRHFLMAGPLLVNPRNLQRLSSNLAFLTVTDGAGVETEVCVWLMPMARFMYASWHRNEDMLF